MPVQLAAVQQTPPVQLGMPVQLTLHAAPEQLTRALHDRAPGQSTALVFPLHEIGCVQESASWQRTSHDFASHTIAPVHVSGATHVTLHLLPPQAIPCLQEPAPTQLMMKA